MANKVRSARGVEVDFDMIKLKAQLAGAVAPVAVTNRQKFINDLEGVKIKPLKSSEDIAAAAKAHAAEQRAKLGEPVSEVTGDVESIDIGIIEEEPIEQSTKPVDKVVTTRKSKSRTDD